MDRHGKGCQQFPAGSLRVLMNLSPLFALLPLYRHEGKCAARAGRHPVMGAAAYALGQTAAHSRL